jgi:ectoine hydroxylase-related dioxygenase (phytanoyl-CoA dioxygenase family)
MVDATARHGAEALDDYLFDTRGFVKRPRCLGEDEVAALHRHLAPHWRETTSPGVRRIRDLRTASPELADLAERLPRALGIYRFINQPFRLIEAYALHRIAGSEQDLHNGHSQPQASPWGIASRTMWRHHTYHDGRTYCMMVKVLVYLSDVRSPEDGPFCLVEGSHKANHAFPLRPEELDAAIAAGSFPGLSTVCAEIGDVLILNEALMHGTLCKTSKQPRVVLAFSYAPRFVSDYAEVRDGSTAAICETDFYP